jgi:hypothetical protein
MSMPLAARAVGEPGVIHGGSEDGEGRASPEQGKRSPLSGRFTPFTGFTGFPFLLFLPMSLHGCLITDAIPAIQ